MSYDCLGFGDLVGRFGGSVSCIVIRVWLRNECFLVVYLTLGLRCEGVDVLCISAGG